MKRLLLLIMLSCMLIVSCQKEPTYTNVTVLYELKDSDGHLIDLSNYSDSVAVFTYNFYIGLSDGENIPNMPDSTDHYLNANPKNLNLGLFAPDNRIIIYYKLEHPDDHYLKLSVNGYTEIKEFSNRFELYVK